MKKNLIVPIFILFFLILLSSGCTDIFSTGDGKTRYQSHPTALSYDITYGYIVKSSGQGEYEIKYELDKAELLRGSVTSTEPKFSQYSEEIMATFNDMIVWNISDNIDYEYDLRITASVVSQSYILTDLNGADALTISEISILHADKVNSFCNQQSDDGNIYIDPDDPIIYSTAKNIYNSAGTDNSLIIAKELFKWLKGNTNYSYNINSENVKQACTTFEDEAGDCDDLSFLYISLCRAVNIPARFIKGFLVQENNAIPHAWVEVFVGGGLGASGWIPVECAGTASLVKTEVHQNFGIETAEHLRLFTDDGSDKSLNISLSGISYRIYSANRNIQTQSSQEVNNYSVTNSQMLVIDENQKRSYE